MNTMSATSDMRTSEVQRKVILMLLAVALLCTGIVMFVVKRENQTVNDIDPEVMAVSYPIVIPELCRTLVEADAGRRKDAYNAFYEKAHPALHVLAADVDTVEPNGRSIGSELRRAKSKVEAGVITFPPTLTAEIATLIDVTGDALTAVGYSGETTC